jgi:hypothetical protein
VSAVAADLQATTGFVVADNRGRVVGRVESPMYEPVTQVPDALAVRPRRLSRHLRLVPANTIATIDEASGVVALSVARDAIRRFH